MTGSGLPLAPAEVLQKRLPQKKLELFMLQHYCCNHDSCPRATDGFSMAGSAPGIHQAGLNEVATAFATDTWRRELFDGLVDASGWLRRAGCLMVYLDGSYVSGKPKPGDFDACWDPYGVDQSKLDPVFLQFTNGRQAQKAAFKGEFFPSSMMCADVGQAFVEFFQQDCFTGKQKGIISIPLSVGPLLSGKVQP